MWVPSTCQARVKKRAASAGQRACGSARGFGAASGEVTRVPWLTHPGRSGAWEWRGLVAQRLLQGERDRHCTGSFVVRRTQGRGREIVAAQQRTTAFEDL